MQGFVTSVIIVSIILSPYALQIVTPTTVQNNSAQHVTKICDRITIWHWSQFETYLRGCTVIEGSLQINILFDSAQDVEISRISTTLRFPELKEITGFLMVFFTESIISLNTLFPSLAVIRGQELVEKYALVINKMPDMLEVGLTSLTHIYVGGVWIVGNDKLCFVDTVDWAMILNPSSSNSDVIIRKNGPQCSNYCPTWCKSDDSNNRQLCWNELRCQVTPSSSCPHCPEGRSCFGNKGSEECCDSQCAGTCRGPLPSDCAVCKNVGLISSESGKEICLEKCPFPYFEYLGRRCLTEEQCLNIRATAPSNHPTNPQELLQGKIYHGHDNDNLCVLDCPVGSQHDKNGSICAPCVGGRCYKTCQGGTVDTIEAARKYSGCTRVVGHLKIHMRAHAAVSDASVKTLASLLKENLGHIEIIDEFLLVSHTYALYSLDFLESLKVIEGKVLSDNSHALVIKSNDNMKYLWSEKKAHKKNVKISNQSARVQFHYNPQLCPDNIYKFLTNSGVKANLSMNPMDIGITNGDKVTCNTKKLRIMATKVNSTCVTLQWENFGRNLTAPSYLLNYEVHYKATTFRGREKKLALRDPCGQDEWNVMDVSALRDEKGLDQTVNENPVQLCNLLPYTNYAIYVKAIVLPGSLYALNNNTGAESNMRYVKTDPDVPGSPAELTLQNKSPDTVSVRWTLPNRTNGPLTHFKVLLRIRIEANLTSGTSEQFGYCEAESGKAQRKSSPSSASSSPRPSFFYTTAKPHLKKNRDENEMKNQAIEESEMLHVILGDHLFTGAGIRPPFVNDDNNTTTNSGDIHSRRRKRTTNFPHTADSMVRNLADNYKVVSEHVERFNPNVTSYHIDFKRLKHFTNYYVEVKACRHDANADVDVCSDRRENVIRTPASQSADLVQNITYTMSNSTLILHWIEPSAPNGAILAYIITFNKRQKLCISREEFLLQNLSYIHPEPLYAGGNYSVRIQTKSHFGTSDPSDSVYVFVEDTIIRHASEGSNPTWIYLFILLLLFILTGIGAHFFLLFKKLQKRRVQGNLVTSPNPEYTPALHVPTLWDIDRNNLDVHWDSILGSGSFSTVYKGVWEKRVVEESGGGGSSSTSSSSKKGKSKFTKVKVICAVKELKEETPPEDKEDLIKEALIMSRLVCPHVVKLLGIVSLGSPILVVMEYMENKDLRAYLRSISKGLTSSNSSTSWENSEMGNNSNDPLLLPEGSHSHNLTLMFLFSIASSIADGMAYIHSQGCVHRDLAARNCMVDANLRVKVGDFGLSKEMSDYYKLKSKGRFPYRWMAPECFLDNIITYKSDVWSYGVLLYEIATLGNLPYAGLNNHEVTRYVCSKKTLEMPETCPNLFLTLAQDCFTFNRDQRPSFLQILERLMVEAYSDSFAAISFYHSKEGICAKNMEMFDKKFFNGDIPMPNNTITEEDVVVSTSAVDDNNGGAIAIVERDDQIKSENVTWQIETAQVHFSP